MKKINIGLLNLIYSTSLKEDSLLHEIYSEDTKKGALNYLNVIKNSPMLQLEFKVFENIERKYIDNDMLAVRYIDDNIKLFEVYTLEEINAEHEKLKSCVINENMELDENKVDLYNSIWTLIEESLQVNENVDVDNIHESFNCVLNHIKTNKKSVKKDVLNINEEVIEIAISKFNKEYDKMSLAEGVLFKKLINSNIDEKKVLFEEYKSDNISLLNALNKENINTKVLKSIQKISEMKYNPETVDVDIISLFELNKGLN